MDYHSCLAEERKRMGKRWKRRMEKRARAGGSWRRRERGSRGRREGERECWRGRTYEHTHISYIGRDRWIESEQTKEKKEGME